jgi:hypothetical protein
MAIWIAQFVDREIRLLDYIEGVGQPLAYYATELRRRGWKDAISCLPHDGVAANNTSGKRYIDHWVEAGFECEPPIKSSGALLSPIAVMMRAGSRFDDDHDLVRVCSSEIGLDEVVAAAFRSLRNRDVPFLRPFSQR